MSFRQSKTSLRKRSMSRRKCTFSTTNRTTLLFSSTIRLVSLSKFSKYFGFNSNLCCCLFSSSSSFRRTIDMHFLCFLLSQVTFTSARWCPSNVLSNSVCSLCSLLSWPYILHSAVFQCLSGLFPVIVKILFWSIKFNLIFVAVPVVVRVGGPNVAIECNSLFISQKKLVAQTY